MSVNIKLDFLLDLSNIEPSALKVPISKCIGGHQFFFSIWPETMALKISATDSELSSDERYVVGFHGPENVWVRRISGWFPPLPWSV